jgi:hypothetical protein
MRTRIALLVAALTIAVTGVGSLVWTDAASADDAVVWGN